MTRKYFNVLFIVLLISSCGKQAQPVMPTETPIPVPTQDPAVFGAIGTGDIQAFALEWVANAIFKKTMDGFVAGGTVQEYQVTSVTIFPGSGGLLAEIIYNVKTSDPTWLADGGTQSPEGWISGNCSRFDFFTTDTEYQLKNKRLCG